MTVIDESSAANGTEVVVRTHRRRRVVAGAVVAAIVLVAAWWWASAPDWQEGNVLGPSTGMDPVSDSIEQTKWMVTDDVGTLVFSVYNGGRFATTLSARAQDYSAWVGPRLRIGFAPANERLDPIASKAWEDLDATVVVQPGQQAWVVLNVVYPKKCQAPDPFADNVTSYYYRTIPLTSSSLGRTSDVDLPLTYPVYISKPGSTNCTEADFVALDAAFPPR